MTKLAERYSDITILLLEHYPDKVVVGLSKEHHNLYASIQYRAKNENLSVKKFIESLGFVYGSSRSSDTDERKCNRCSNILPDDYKGKTCPVCSEKNKEANKLRREKLKKSGRCISCKVKLPNNYEYVQCEDCLKTSNERVQSLRQFRIKNHQCEDCGVDLAPDYTNRKCQTCKDHYNELCRSYTNDNSRIIYTPEYISGLLFDYYRDKPVQHLQSEYYNLYHVIYRYAKEQNMSVNEYIEALGFTVA